MMTLNLKKILPISQWRVYGLILLSVISTNAFSASEEGKSAFMQKRMLPIEAKVAAMAITDEDRALVSEILQRPKIESLSIADAKQKRTAVVASEKKFADAAKSLLDTMGVWHSGSHKSLETALTQMHNGFFVGGVHWVDRSPLPSRIKDAIKVGVGERNGYFVTTIVPTDPEISRKDLEALARVFKVGALREFKVIASDMSADEAHRLVEKKAVNGEGLMIVTPHRLIDTTPFLDLGYDLHRFVFYGAKKPHSVLVVRPKNPSGQKPFKPQPTYSDTTFVLPKSSSASATNEEGKSAFLQKRVFPIGGKVAAMAITDEDRALVRKILQRPKIESMSLGDAKRLKTAVVGFDPRLTPRQAQGILNAMYVSHSDKVMRIESAMPNIRSGMFSGGAHLVSEDPVTLNFNDAISVHIGQYEHYFITTIVPTYPEISSEDLAALARVFKVGGLRESKVIVSDMTVGSAKDLVLNKAVKGDGLMIVLPHGIIGADALLNSGYDVYRFVFYEAEIPHAVLVVTQKNYSLQKSFASGSPTYSDSTFVPQNPSAPKPFTPQPTYSGTTFVPQNPSAPKPFTPRPTYSDPTFVPQQQFAPQPTHSDPTFVSQQSFSAQQQFAPQPTYMPVLSAQELTTLRKEELIQRKGIQLAIGNPVRGAEVIKNIKTKLQLSNPSVITQTKAEDLLKNGEFLDGMVWIGKGRELSTEWKGIRRVDMGNFRGYTLTGVMPSDPELTQEDFEALSQAFKVYTDVDMGVPVQPFEAGKSAIIAKSFKQGVVLVQPKRQIPLLDFSGGDYNINRFVLRRDGQTHSVVVVTR